ncbi:uncharacterized protein LOC111893012 [Lactuca sativa]|uniref:uncharacterized protein LOC111893012 n=1 Tax=Lactuca sativa TaxID=4236 RepID=UPI000CD89FB2|nr:uncharacterized protein LOC111893012 [Lactuca sativa]
MNFMTLNIRGIGDSKKIEWIRKLKLTQSIDFICIQETRVSDFNNIDIVGCWGSTNYQCDFVNPTRGSGGILSIWDPRVFRKSNTFSSRHFIATSGEWVGISGAITIVNVYGPQSIVDKRKLWDDLIDLKKGLNGIWVFTGDFNAVRFACERFNSSFCHYMASDFNRFIAVAGLNEFIQGGRKLTYLRDDGLKQSKLDRFLVCHNFIQVQPLTSVTVLPRDYSDHSPVILKPHKVDFGPPPFRFFNSWLLHNDFNLVFDKAWGNFHGFGAPDRFLPAKIKFLKNERIGGRK